MKPGYARLARAGTAKVVATGLATPNGIAVTPDGTTLIAAETFGNRLPTELLEEYDTLVKRLGGATPRS